MIHQQAALWIGCGVMTSLLIKMATGFSRRQSLTFAMTLGAAGGFLGGASHVALHVISENDFPWWGNAWQGLLLASLASAFVLIAFETFVSRSQHE